MSEWVTVARNGVLVPGEWRFIGRPEHSPLRSEIPEIQVRHSLRYCFDKGLPL